MLPFFHFSHFHFFFPKRRRRVPVVVAPKGGLGGLAADLTAGGGGEGLRIIFDGSDFLTILRVASPAAFWMNSGPDLGPFGIHFRYVFHHFFDQNSDVNWRSIFR